MASLYWRSEVVLTKTRRPFGSGSEAEDRPAALRPGSPSDSDALLTVPPDGLDADHVVTARQVLDSFR